MTKKKGWKQLLKTDEKGRIRTTPQNLSLIAEKDEMLKTISYDQFHERYIASENSPFRPRNTEFLDNTSFADISRHLEEEYGFRITCASMEERILTIIKGLRSFHPIQNFILTEKWDGIPRVDTLLIDYLGAEDTLLNRQITRKWMAAAVARVFLPGTKFDYVLTLTGPEGTGKSTLFRKLAEEWFNDTFSFAFDNKQLREAISAKWIIEIAELSGLRKAEVAAAKAFISATEDTFRPAYGRVVETHPRQCVFAATTNEEYFLRSITGDRRWWVVDVAGNGSVEKWLPNLIANVHQIWAEAYSIFLNGEPLYLPEALEAEMRKMQQEHNIIVGSGILGELEEWLNTLLPFNWDSMSRDARKYFFRGDFNPTVRCIKRREIVSVVEVKNEFPGQDFRGISSQTIGAWLDKIPGWKRVKSPNGKHQSRYRQVYGSQKVWRRVEPDTLF